MLTHPAYFCKTAYMAPMFHAHAADPHSHARTTRLQGQRHHPPHGAVQPRTEPAGPCAHEGGVMREPRQWRCLSHALRSQLHKVLTCLHQALILQRLKLHTDRPQVQFLLHSVSALPLLQLELPG